MARNDFAIEPPRKIKISIPGYKPQVAAEAPPPQQKKKKRRQRKQRSGGGTSSSSPQNQQRRSGKPATQAGAKVPKHRRNDEAEIEALAAAAAATPIPPEVEDQLLRAFSGTHALEKGGQHADE